MGAEQQDHRTCAGRLGADARRKNAAGIFHGRRFPSAIDRQRLRGAELGQGPKHDDESGWAPCRPADRQLAAEGRCVSIDERQPRRFCGSLYRRPAKRSGRARGRRFSRPKDSFHVRRNAPDRHLHNRRLAPPGDLHDARPRHHFELRRRGCCRRRSHHHRHNRASAGTGFFLFGARDRPGPIVERRRCVPPRLAQSGRAGDGHSEGRLPRDGRHARHRGIGDRGASF